MVVGHRRWHRRYGISDPQDQKDFTQKDNGSGIGLALCKTLAETSEGQLTVHSEVGRGTTVSLHLPISDSEPQGGLA